MKRKLSLLMVLMMMLTLIPANMAFAASETSVTTQTVASNSTFDTQIVVNPDDSIGFTSGGTFEILLGDNASFDSFSNVTGATVSKISSKILEVTPNSSLNNVSLIAKVILKNAAKGDQKLDIRNVNANATDDTLVYAKVAGDGEVLVRTLTSPKTVTRAGNNTIAPLEIREASAGLFVAGDDITLELPKGFTWLTVPSITGATVFSGLNTNKLVIDTTVATSNIDRIVLSNATVGVARDARTGMVEVKVSSTKFSTEYVDVAEYKDYNVTASVDKVETLVAGTYDERDNKVEFTLEGNGDNSFVVNRDIKVTVANGTVAIKKANSFVNRIEDEKGRIYEAPLSTFTSTKYVDEFYLFANANADELVLDFDVKGDWDAGGKAVEITVEGAGVEKQTVKLADIVAPATVTTKIGNKTVADVVLGLQRQQAPDVIITETGKASLSEGFYVIDFPDQRFNGVQIMDADIEIEGDIEANIEVKGDKIFLEIENESRVASKITINNIVVTLDRTVPFGPLNARFGVAYDSSDTLITKISDFDYAEDIVAKIPYINVVTSIQDNRRQQTVFTLDSVTYTVGTETKTLDAAPYISNNRTMLPMGTVAQLVGATVNYSAASRTAVFTKDNLVVSMNLDTNILLVNGSPVMMDAKPEIVNSRAFVPVVYVAQAFGIQNGTDIVYDAATRTVTLFPQAQ